MKGKELTIPKGDSFADKDGTMRTEIRIKWWENPLEMTYKSISVEDLSNLSDSAIDISLLKDKDYYKNDDKLVFFGHYWLKGKPLFYRKNICCLDYSVAKQGYLVAYSFDEELELDLKKFTYV